MLTGGFRRMANERRPKKPRDPYAPNRIEMPDDLKAQIDAMEGQNEREKQQRRMAQYRKRFLILACLGTAWIAALLFFVVNLPFHYARRAEANMMRGLLGLTHRANSVEVTPTPKKATPAPKKGSRRPKGKPTSTPKPIPAESGNDGAAVQHYFELALKDFKISLKIKGDNFHAKFLAMKSAETLLALQGNQPDPALQDEFKKLEELVKSAPGSDLLKPQEERQLKERRQALESGERLNL